jgi:hypothetical protein
MQFPLMLKIREVSNDVSMANTLQVRDLTDNCRALPPTHLAFEYLDHDNLLRSQVDSLIDTAYICT